MRPTLLVAAVLACGLVFAVQEGTPDPELELETWPDGSKRVEREVVREADGEAVAHGVFRSWFENGQLESEGQHKNGWRSGSWTFFHESGEKAAEGAYRLGLRNTRWKYWDEKGEVISELSGTYRAEIEEYDSGARRIGGEYRGKHKHGRWTYYAEDGLILAAGEYSRDRRNGAWSFQWPASGAPMFQGEYRRDECEGPWVFRHLDGTVDPELLSGVYDEGERKGGLPEVDLAEIDLSRLPAPEPASGLTEEARAKLEEDVRGFLAGGTRRATARAAILEAGRGAVPSILATLRELELGDRASVQLGFHLNYDLLGALHHGHAYAWFPGTSEQDIHRNQLSILRWHALWETTRASAGFVEALTPLPAGTPYSDALLELPFDPFQRQAVAPVATAVADSIELLSARERRRLLGKYGGKGTEDALEAALEWLLAHQSGDGSWDADGFSMRCAMARAKTFCSGPGRDGAEVGVTALALSALMGDASGPGVGPHGAAVEKGIDWLVAKQDATTGLIGSTTLREYVYGHAMATIALCTALRSGGAPELRDNIRKAVDYLLAQRLPAGAWRYGVKTGDKPDSSVTCWVLHALHAAARCGVEVPEDVEHFAWEWIASVTDPKTSRVGYDFAGGSSARVPGLNDHISPEVCETLTAAALYARLDSPNAPEAEAVVREQVSLILEHLPWWQPDGSDFYGWYHATYALFLEGGIAWKKWNAPLVEALLEAQVNEKGTHQHGSFPVDVAWGGFGGRVYTTAICALMLEVYWRADPGR